MQENFKSFENVKIKVLSLVGKPPLRDPVPNIGKCVISKPD